MKITLVDANAFAETKGKEFCEDFLVSFNMNGKCKIWSNGWCPVNRFKKTAYGTVIARIQNELVPIGIYNGVEIEYDPRAAFIHAYHRL